MSITSNLSFIAEHYRISNYISSEANKKKVGNISSLKIFSGDSILKSLGKKLVVLRAFEHVLLQNLQVKFVRFLSSNPLFSYTSCRITSQISK